VSVVSFFLLSSSWSFRIFFGCSPTINLSFFVFLVFLLLSNNGLTGCYSGLSPEIAHFYLEDDGRNWTENAGHDWYVKGME
jgi:hypothetical protein